MGNSSSSSLKNSIVEASVVSGCRNGGQVDLDRSILAYFEGGAESTQIIKVKSLRVMRRELAGKSTSSFHHEFLMIDAVLQLSNCGLRVTILAEKVCNNDTSSGLNVGGVIRIREADAASLRPAEMKCKIKLKKCGRIAVKDLFDDLKEHNLRYSVGMHNCWKYAYDASCKVLKRCEELQDTSEETKKDIRRFRERELKKPELLGEYVKLRDPKFWFIVIVAGVVITVGMIWWGKMLISGPILKACLKGLTKGLTGAGDPIWWTFGRLSDPSARRVVVEGLGAGITPLQLQSLRNIGPILATKIARRVSLNLADIIFRAAVAFGIGLGIGAAYLLAQIGKFLWRVAHPEQSSLLADPSMLISENAVQ